MEDGARKVAKAKDLEGRQEERMEDQRGGGVKGEEL